MDLEVDWDAVEEFVVQVGRRLEFEVVLLGAFEVVLRLMEEVTERLVVVESGG